MHVKLPPEIEAVTRGASWTHIPTGESGATVYRLTDGSGAACYLKITPPGSSLPVSEERARLEWLSGRLPVPKALAFGERGGSQFLLTRALPGVTAIDPPHGGDVSLLVNRLAAALRLIHETPVGDCPFDHSIDATILWGRERAERRAASDPAMAAYCAEGLAARPASEGRVLTHGDYCLPNILFDARGLTGFIDVGMAGIGDPYRDIALCTRSIKRNLGEEWIPVFLRDYGLTAPDNAAIRFYQALEDTHGP